MTPLRILVVEDDAMIAMLFTEMLEGMGHDVCGSVASEAEAVAAARSLAPDLMIVDELDVPRPELHLEPQVG